MTDLPATTELFAAESVLFPLLRASLFGGEVPLCPDKSALASALELAKRHDLAHLLCGLPGVPAPQDLKYLAVWRCETQMRDLASVSEALSAAKIVHVPLKGCVLRSLYPEPWMRTSSDVDILVHREDLESAAETLRKVLGCSDAGASSHDVSLLTAAGTQVELHHTLVEHDQYLGAAALARVWEEARPETEDAFRYVLSDAMRFAYHLAHMAKHVQTGGCGIRPFLDLLFLEHCPGADAEGRAALLEESGLSDFALRSASLAAYWFSGTETDAEALAPYRRFILSGGVFGTQENSVAALRGRQPDSSETAYVMRRLFLPYESLANLYPGLRGRKYLMPWYELKRAVNVAATGRTKKTLRELRLNRRLSETQLEETAVLMRSLGLRESEGDAGDG